MHECGEEQKQLHASEHIAQTHTTADAERHEEGGLLDLALGVNEPPWIELLRKVPQLGVHVNAVNERNDVRTGRNRVAIQLDISIEMKKER